MDYLYEYLLFLFQAATIAAAALIVFSGFLALGARRRHGGPEGHLEVTKLNDSLEDLKRCIDQAVLPKDEFKKAQKAAAKAEKRQKQKKQQKQQKQEKQEKEASAPAGRVFALAFEGDLQATRVARLRHEINAILAQAREGDEVLVRIESPGGLVHGYGLVASQLLRIRERGLALVAAVDKVAASGGYLAAAVANRVIAAPFAVVGSIGVVAQIPNVHRLLKKKDVDVEVLTAGRYKRTMTVFGENTEEGRRKFLEEIEDLHALFQEFVADHRPGLDLEKVATGESWYGRRAIEFNLVDEIMTSDEYLMKRCQEAEVYEIRWVTPKKPLDKVLEQVEGRLSRLAERLFGRGW